MKNQTEGEANDDEANGDKSEIRVEWDNERSRRRGRCRRHEGVNNGSEFLLQS